ncbi:hypothetical protein JTB14_000722 [Gonioctena quinquepunctata]|nr:hypothetical protein JTB14_000722 [Gonioctena quinquepunctata]
MKQTGSVYWICEHAENLTGQSLEKTPAFAPKVKDDVIISDHEFERFGKLPEYKQNPKYGTCYLQSDELERQPVPGV